MSSHSAPRPGSARVLAGVLLVGLVAAAGLALALTWPGPSTGRDRAATVADRGPAADQAPAEQAPRGEVRAAEVLGDWDRRRAQVWAAGGEPELAALYVAGSAAGRRDVAMLASWRARGLRVEGLTTQVLDLRLLAREPGRIDVQVVDRVVAGVAVGPGVRRPLPADAPTTRRVVLVDGPTGWRVAGVSAGPRPPRP